MRIRRIWWLGAAPLVAGLLVAALVVPARAASSGQSDGPAPDTYTAMHEACETGDVLRMTEAMDALTDEDWEAMAEHMSDGHHGAMGSGMMGMGGWSGTAEWR